MGRQASRERKTNTNREIERERERNGQSYEIENFTLSVCQTGITEKCTNLQIGVIYEQVCFVCVCVQIKVKSTWLE